MEWIEVRTFLGDVNLPKINKRVIICTGGGAISFGKLIWHEQQAVKTVDGSMRLNHSMKWDCGLDDKPNPFTHFEVTHWMPLPEPPTKH